MAKNRPVAVALPSSEERGAQADDQAKIARSVMTVRSVPVMLASDLADFFGTTTGAVNQYRSRNAAKFGQDYAFQLTPEEWVALKSQTVISNSGRGGSRHAPWVYTEHGVAMISMGMTSEKAVRLSRVIIDTFVSLRRGSLPADRALPNLAVVQHRRSLQEKILGQIESLLDAKLPTNEGHTVRDEIGTIATSALGHIKAVLDAPGKSNEKISAEVTKILAEAEKVYAETRKLHAETDRIHLDNYRARLDFIRDLREMAMQLERDDWMQVFDQRFGVV